MKAIQNTAVIEIGYERLSRRNGRRTNRSAYITRRGMNIHMIRMICGDEEGIRVPGIAYLRLMGCLPRLDYSVCTLCMDLARFCHKNHGDDKGDGPSARQTC